jgi:superfamily I DNA/RNA helicase
MNSPNLTPFWLVCENAWGAWLATNQWTVIHLRNGLRNGAGTDAPMITLSTGDRVVAPDYQSMKAGQTRYWEVKSRVRPLIDSMTSIHCHWISAANFYAYRSISQDTGITLTIVVCEGPTASLTHRWLSIDIDEVAKHASIRKLPKENGSEQEVICWPVSVMTTIEGPDISSEAIQNPLFNSLENQQTPMPAAIALADTLRKKQIKKPDFPTATEPTNVIDTPIEAESPIAQLFVHDPFASLEAFRITQQIPALPRYSVLHIAENVSTDFLQLLHFGIRVFLITGPNQSFSMSDEDIHAFREARLLEWAQIPTLKTDTSVFAVDGVIFGKKPKWYAQVLEEADRVGGFNAKQYEIVHASPDSDVLVTAGAGTGKTETMSERLMFLLSTVTSQNSYNANNSNNELLLNEVALVTFTREAAREMRSRIARTLVLRQRMCSAIVHPIMAWIIQLGSAHISTLHAFAKKLIQTHGMQLSISANFSVSTQKMQFQDFIHDVLSEQIVQFIESYPSNENIPEFRWVNFLEVLWQGLENNGVPLVTFGSTGEGSADELVDWGIPNGDSVNAAIATIVRSTIDQTRKLFAEHCQREQAIPTNQLVPTALAAIEKLSEPPQKRYRFIFVDEFQDTDPLQMQMVLTLRQKLHAQLFVVGDPKQGIYRFRGAEGNAFDVLRKNVKARRMLPFSEFTLTLNFRTDGRLLESMHPYFERWGNDESLMYGPQDKLRPNPTVAEIGEPLEIINLRNTKEYQKHAARIIIEWRTQSPQSSIAVLCRTNKHAKEVQKAIREAGGQCDLLVGGDFYTTPAVRELRVFLEVIVNPADNAALLEVCETRWAGRLLDAHSHTPTGVPANLWNQEKIVSMGWIDRMASLSTMNDFEMSDLGPVRDRILSIRTLSKRMSGMSFIVEMQRYFQPENCSLNQPDDETERQRYVRCFTHLLTLMDTQFADSPATLISILEWLKTQISLNRQEDEPVDVEALQGKTTALTVHKSKGLEFDYVLLPNTWNAFERPKNAKHIVSVIQRTDGLRSVLWRWRPERHQNAQTYTNVTEGDPQWNIDTQETNREETRLLYVSMTRARKKLKIVVNPRSKRGNSWSGLLV